MRSELRASSSATRSISSMPVVSSRGRTCPEPICSALAARYTSGRESRLACQIAIAMPASTAMVPTASTRPTARAASQKTSHHDSYMITDDPRLGDLAAV